MSRPSKLCTGVLGTQPGAELCRRCERARPQADRGPWVEPMARLYAGRPICENFRITETQPAPVKAGEG